MYTIRIFGPSGCEEIQRKISVYVLPRKVSRAVAGPDRCCVTSHQQTLRPNTPLIGVESGGRSMVARLLRSPMPGVPYTTVTGLVGDNTLQVSLHDRWWWVQAVPPQWNSTIIVNGYYYATCGTRYNDLWYDGGGQQYPDPACGNAVTQFWSCHVEAC